MVRELATLSWYFISILLLAPAPLSAQSDKPEVFVHAGMFRVGTDEGVIGNAASFGGGVSIPINRRLAAELDVQTGQVAEFMGSPDEFHRTRRTLVLGNLLYRWGSARGYVFAGAGAGAQLVDSTSRSGNFIPEYTPEGWREIRPRVFEIDRSGARPVVFAPRAGFVVYPLQRLGLRADIYAASWHLGVRIGAVYRFN